MRRIVSLAVGITVITLSTSAQTKTTTDVTTDEQKDRSWISIGVSAGMDYNFNAYKFAQNEFYGNTYYGITPRYNIGFDIGLKVAKRLRPRLEFKYVNMQYGMDFTNTAYSYLSKMVANVNYFDFNMRLDYMLIPTGKFQLFVSPGLKYEYETGNTISSNIYSTSSSSAPSTVQFKHPGDIGGGALGLIFKYNVTDHFGITLTPDYTLFFHKFVSDNNKDYTRFSVNIGAEYKF